VNVEQQSPILGLGAEHDMLFGKAGRIVQGIGQGDFDQIAVKKRKRRCQARAKLDGQTAIRERV
jgi:hypothetical protein